MNLAHRTIKQRSLAARLIALLLLANSSLVFAPHASAAEGMWTFDNPPVDQLKERYGFTLTQKWLDHLRLSTVRFSGGTGAFVSPNGLVLTVHHLARGWLEELSSPQKDLVKDGFYARTHAEEIKCAGMELSVLQSMENVTTHVNGAVESGPTSREALERQRAAIAKIEQEDSRANGLTSSVVSLYQGGEYWLYRYKKYTDVRIVFAPEAQIAFFGGDHDNFVYPRYDLDIAFFRVYENGKPAQTPNYLTLNASGAKEDELVFTTGHPGKTERAHTLAQLEFQRDYFIPVNIKENNHRIVALQRYAGLGPEQARQAEGELFGYQTGLKLITGWLTGLLGKNIIAKKEKEEAEFRALVTSRSEWKREFGDTWDALAEAKKKQREMFKCTEFRQWNVSRLPAVALNIVQYVSEVKKPDAERLNGFHDSQLSAMKSRLLAPIIYPGLQEVLLADSLQESFEELGPDDSFVKATLSNRPASDVAKELVLGTKVFDVNFRRSLIEGGEAVVAGTDDPLIVTARKIDPIIREMRMWVEENVASVETTNNEKIGKARFAVYGKRAYPDATSTLRLSYGTIKKYSLNGTIAPTKTTFYGLYDRALSFDLNSPFDLTARFLERKHKFDLSTPLNFICTCDAVGGSSGSPVINRNGELVGVIFDINIESLVGRFVYNEEANRAVAVHSASIVAVLRHLYEADALADEIERTDTTK